MIKIIKSNCRQVHPGLAAWHGGHRLQRDQGAKPLGEKELLAGTCHGKDFAGKDGDEKETCQNRRAQFIPGAGPGKCHPELTGVCRKGDKTGTARRGGGEQAGFGERWKQGSGTGT